MRRRRASRSIACGPACRSWPATAAALRVRSEAALAEFRRVFPAALCFRQIVPVDEVVTMNQFFRADEPFARLMLGDVDRARLDRLWHELHYVSQDGIRVYQNLDQMLGFASQEGQTAKVEGWRKPITAAYEAAVKVQAASEPKQIDTLLAFAAPPIAGRCWIARKTSCTPCTKSSAARDRADRIGRIGPDRGTEPPPTTDRTGPDRVFCRRGLRPPTGSRWGIGGRQETVGFRPGVVRSQP